MSARRLSRAIGRVVVEKHAAPRELRGLPAAVDREQAWRDRRRMSTIQRPSTQVSVARTSEKFAAAVDTATQNFALAAELVASLRSSGSSGSSDSSSTGVALSAATRALEVTHAALTTVLQERFSEVMSGATPAASPPSANPKVAALVDTARAAVAAAGGNPQAALRTLFNVEPTTRLAVVRSLLPDSRKDNVVAEVAAEVVLEMVRMLGDTPQLATRIDGLLEDLTPEQKRGAVYVARATEPNSRALRAYAKAHEA